MDPTLHAKTIRNICAAVYSLMKADVKIFVSPDMSCNFINTFRTNTIVHDCVYIHGRSPDLLGDNWSYKGLSMNLSALYLYGGPMFRVPSVSDLLPGILTRYPEANVIGDVCYTTNFRLIEDGPMIRTRGSEVNLVDVIMACIGINHYTVDTPIPLEINDQDIRYGWVVPGAKNLSSRAVEEFVNDFRRLCETYDATANIEYHGGFACACEAIIGDKEYQETQRIVSQLAAKCVVRREFSDAHPIHEKIKDLVTKHHMWFVGYSPRLYQHITELNGIRIIGGILEYQPDSEVNPKTAQERYLKHYDGWRIGNPKLELLLWRYFVVHPFNVFPRDIMRMIIREVMILDAILALEQIFDHKIIPDKPPKPTLEIEI